VNGRLRGGFGGKLDVAIRQSGQENERTSQGGDIRPQRADPEIRKPFELGHSGLLDAEPARQGRLRNAAGPSPNLGPERVRISELRLEGTVGEREPPFV